MKFFEFEDERKKKDGFGPGGSERPGCGGPGPRQGFPRPPFCPGRRPPLTESVWFEKHYASMSREEKLCFQIGRLARLMGRVPGAVLGQSKVLNILTEKDGCTQRELTEKAGVQPGTMSEILKKLEIGGYIRRLPDPRDGRGFVICLTEAGSIAAKSISKSVAGVFDDLTETERDQLLFLLEKLEKSWRGKMPKPPCAPFVEKTQKA